MEYSEHLKYKKQLRVSVIFILVATIMLLVCHYYMKPYYSELTNNISQTSVLAQKISNVVNQDTVLKTDLENSGKTYVNLVDNRDTYIEYLGTITQQNGLNINKMTVGDVEQNDLMDSLTVEIELQGDLYNIKNMLIELYNTDIVNRINSFSYRLQTTDDVNLQWMWRSIDDKQLVTWWDSELGDEYTPEDSEEEYVLNADDLMKHGTALCYIEIEFLGTRG